MERHRLAVQQRLPPRIPPRKATRAPGKNRKETRIPSRPRGASPAPRRKAVTVRRSVRGVSSGFFRSAEAGPFISYTAAEVDVTMRRTRGASKHCHACVRVTAALGLVTEPSCPMRHDQTRGYFAKSLDFLCLCKHFPLFFLRLGAWLTHARLLRPPQLGIFLRSFPLNRPTLFAGNDRRNLLDLGRPRYGDHESARLLVPFRISIHFGVL